MGGLKLTRRLTVGKKLVLPSTSMIVPRLRDVHSTCTSTIYIIEHIMFRSAAARLCRNMTSVAGRAGFRAC